MAVPKRSSGRPAWRRGVTSTGTRRRAPRATAGAMGVFTSRPPSQSSRSSSATGLKRSGMAALAITISGVMTGS